MNERRVNAAKNMAVRQRNYRRARERALTALAQQYPDDYKSLLEREKARDEQLGKKWLDINGTTIADQLGVRPPATVTGTQTSDTRESEGNNGGEA